MKFSTFDFKTEHIQLKVYESILFVYYTPSSELKKIDEDFARKAVNDRLQFTQGKPYLMLVDARHFGEVTKQAMRYWSSEEAIQDVLAGAIVTDRSVTYIPAKLYLKLELLYKKPNFPADMFLSEKKAVSWLKKQSFLVC